MRFAEPFWLVFGAAVVVVLLILRIRSESLTRRAIDTLTGARLVSASSLPSRFRRWLRVAVVCLAVSMAFVALARPQKGLKWQTLDRKGTDLLLVIDTSKSMNADDVTPTRLERTKLAVRDLVERFPGDRIGLVAFAGDAYLESPMTLDHDALLETLGAFDTSIISRGGTDIGGAIDSASAALKAESGGQKIMVLLTDGEDLEGKGVEAAKRARDAGITIDTVGVGTPAGELVPAKNDQGATVGLVRDDTGAPVRSRLDEAGLRAIAEAAHGTYRPLGADGRGLDRLYTESLAPLSHTEHAARFRRVYAEWFAVPLALSLFGIVLDALLGFRAWPRSRTRRVAPGSRAVRSSAIAAVLVLASFPGRASASVGSAEKAYTAGHFDESARDYQAEQARHPRDARLAVDAAAADYRAGHYDAAESAYAEALKAADPKLQQRILYDVGDARYRLGEATLKDAPEKTIERWKAAIASYDGALKLQPTDADARFNRDFVKRKLAELENKQKENPQNNPSNQGKNGNDSKKGGNDGKSDGKGQSNNDSNKGGQGQNAGDPNKAQNGEKPGEKGQNGNDPSKADKKNAGAPEPKPGQSTGGNAPDQKPNPQSGRSPGDQRPTDSKDESGSATPAGKLSPHDARALLDSLRGDERHGIRFGNSKTDRGDDSPQKDW